MNTRHTCTQKAPKARTTHRSRKRREAKKEGNKGNPSRPKQEHRHSHRVLLTSQLQLLQKKQGRQSAATWMFPISCRSAMRMGCTLHVEAFSLPVTPPPGIHQAAPAEEEDDEAQAEYAKKRQKRTAIVVAENQDTARKDVRPDEV